MARPRKNPTKVVRINALILIEMKKKAKKRKMSIPDYLSMRLSQ